MQGKLALHLHLHLHVSTRVVQSHCRIIEGKCIDSKVRPMMIDFLFITYFRLGLIPSPFPFLSPPSFPSFFIHNLYPHHLYIPSHSPPHPSLNLSWNSLGYEFALTPLCESLRESTCSLIELDLRHNHIDESGAAILAGMLDKNTSLKRLGTHHHHFHHPSPSPYYHPHHRSLNIDLRWNLLREEGARVICIAMLQNHTLHSCYMTGNRSPKAIITVIGENDS